LLRGGDIDELSKVKKVILRMLPYQSNARFESAFLMASWANTQIPIEPLRPGELSLSPYVRLKSRTEDPCFQAKCDHPQQQYQQSTTKKKIFQGKTRRKAPEPVSYASNRFLPESAPDARTANRRRLTWFRSDVAFTKHNTPVSEEKCEEQEKADGAIESKALPTPLPSERSYILFSSYDRTSKAWPHYCIFPWPVNIVYYAR